MGRMELTYPNSLHQFVAPSVYGRMAEIGHPLGLPPMVKRLKLGHVKELNKIKPDFLT